MYNLTACGIEAFDAAAHRAEPRAVAVIGDHGHDRVIAQCARGIRAAAITLDRAAQRINRSRTRTEGTDPQHSPAIDRERGNAVGAILAETVMPEGPRTRIPAGDTAGLRSDP